MCNKSEIYVTLHSVTREEVSPQREGGREEWVRGLAIRAIVPLGRHALLSSLISEAKLSRANVFLSSGGVKCQILYMCTMQPFVNCALAAVMCEIICVFILHQHTQQEPVDVVSMCNSKFAMPQMESH